MAEKIGNVSVDLIPEASMARWKKELEATTKKIGPVTVEVLPDVSRPAMVKFRTVLQAKLDKMNFYVNVTPKISKSALRKTTRELNQYYKDKNNAPGVYLNPQFRMTDVRKSIVDLNKKLAAAGKPTIYIDVSTKEGLAARQAEVAAFQARTEAMEKATIERTRNRKMAASRSVHAHELALLKLEQRERERISAIINKGLDATGVARYESTVIRSLRTLTKAWALYGAGATAAIAGLSTYAIYSFAQLEDSANMASQVFANNISGMSRKTSEEFVKANREIRKQVLIGAGQIARATAFDLEGAAGSMRALAASGVELSDALGSTKDKIKGLGLTVAQFAQAAGIEDLELATDKLIAIQQQASAAPAFTNVYKTQAEQVERVADLVILASNKALGNAQQLSEALANRVTGQLASMNRPLEEAVTLTAVLSQSGLLGKPGGEQAAIIMRDLAIKAFKFKEEFKALGVEVYDQNGNIRSATSLIDELSISLGSLSDIDRVAALNDAGITLRTQGVFSRLIATSTAIRRQTGKGLKDLENELRTDAAGAVTRQAEARLDTLSMQWQAFTESVKVTFALFGGRAGETVKEFLKEINGDLESGGASPLFTALEPQIESLSKRLDAFIKKIISVVKSPEFGEFGTDIAESFILASKSVLTFFQGFAEGLTGVKTSGGQSLKVIGDIIRSISERLPELSRGVGEAFGKISRFISENSDIIGKAVKGYLMLGVAVFALRRILAPFVIIWRGLRGIFAALNSELAGALMVTLKGLAKSLTKLSVVGTIVIAAVTAIAGAVKGFFSALSDGSENSDGFLRFWKTLGAILQPVGDALEWVFKKIFKLGEAFGRLMGSALGNFLGDIADKMLLFLRYTEEALRIIAKAPKMGWAGDIADDLEKSRKGIESIGGESERTAKRAEDSSQRIIKAVKDIDIAVARPAVGKARNNLADTVLGGGDVQKSAEALRKELAKTGQAEATQFDNRANRLAAQQRDYKSIEKILNRRLTGDVWAAITGRVVDPKEQQVTKGLVSGQEKLAGAIERRILAQAKSLQILAQTGTFSKETVEASLRQLDAALGRHKSKIKIPLTVSQESLDITKRKLEEVSKPRTASITIIERIQSAGKSILDIFKAGAAAKQKSQLEAAIALAQAETTKLQTALGALKTAMRRPAVEAVKGLVAVLMDVPRQLRNAFNVISPQIVQLGAGVGKTLAAGMRSEILNVSKAGTDLGLAAMAGLGAGLKSGFNTVIRPMLKGFTEEIPKLKGPIAYDATLLQPAGTAIMGGFARGLESGFDNVRSWLRAVAPAIEESVPDNLMVERTGKFLVDWLRSGKTLKPEEAFGDLVPKVPDFMGGDIGPIDESLGFLHPTASLRDTVTMANALAKMFGLSVSGGLLRPPGTKTASGNISDHSMGWAADISGPMSNTDRMVAAIKGLFPNVIKQLIWRNKDVNRGFFVGDHMDHAHIAFRPAAGFSLNSGKLGVTPVMPGSGGKAGSSTVMQAIAKAAAATGMPVALIKAIAKQESGFDPRAGSPAGAKGLMQLMPGTARGLGVRDIYDPFQNALGGARYIRSMLGMFKRLDYALAGYNAGPGAVRKFGGIPPYRETQHYVKAVMRYFQQFGGAFGGFRAQGGMVQPGSAYVVGERGRELFVPGQRGNVITNANLERLIKLMEEQERKGKKGVTYQSNMTVQSNSSDPRVVASIVDSHNRYSMSRLNL